MKWAGRKPRPDKIPAHLRCLRCGKGTCRCAAQGAKDVKARAGTRQPRMCGHRYPNGATCHASLAPGERCSRH